MLKAISIIILAACLFAVVIFISQWWLSNSGQVSKQTLLAPSERSSTSSSLSVVASSTQSVATPVITSTSLSTSTSTKPIESESTPVQPVVKAPVSTSTSLSASASTAPSATKEKVILISAVPFTSQAPYSEWSDPLQENGCEEASVLMAVYWARGLKLDQATAKQEIIAMGNYQLQKYGEAVDTDSFDTVSRLFLGYWGFDQAQAHEQLSKSKMINALKAGQLILLPVNGQLLKNPHYTAPGPTTHMLVVLGYDPRTDEFITNDSGTRHGQSYRYPAARLIGAAVNYPTGNHGAQDFSNKTFITVSR
jgi:hypothetical protein